MAQSAPARNKNLLVVGDIIILYFSLWLTLLLRYGSSFNAATWSQHLFPFSVVFGLWIIIFYIDDLYDLSYRQGLTTILVKFARGMFIGAIIAATFFYFGTDRLFSIKPQRVLLINVIASFLLLYGWRIIFYSFTRSLKRANGLLLIGYNALASEIIKKLRENPQLGLQLRAVINYEKQMPETVITDTTVYEHFNDLKKICLNKKITTIVSTIHPRENTDLLQNLFDCLPLNVSFFEITNFYGKITGKIPVTTIEQIWFLENLSEDSKSFYKRLKRVADILISLIILSLAIIFIPFIALAIKLSNPGSVLFVQNRVGKDGKNFKVIKFRTMVTDAEKNGPQWAQTRDDRITPFGRFLRKTRIDEIPQLINVLKGEMSMVGPRPERPEFVEELQKQIPFYKERLLVKPGLTGWAQVMGPSYGGSKEETLEKLQYDLFYIKNRSIALDLSILLKTIRIVLSRRGQ